MFVRTCRSSCNAWTNATSTTQAGSLSPPNAHRSVVLTLSLQACSARTHESLIRSFASTTSQSKRQEAEAEEKRQVSPRLGPSAPRSSYPSSAEARQKRDSDREFLISVLESSATKRDARGYLQTFGSSAALTSAGQKKPSTIGILGVPASVAGRPAFVQGTEKEISVKRNEAPHVAVVKLRAPQAWDDVLLEGVAKTLTRLRDLGLLSVIVLDCDDIKPNQASSWHETVTQQTDRLLRAIGQYGFPAAEVVDSGIWKSTENPQIPSSVPSKPLYVGFGKAFTTPLANGHILVVPPRAYSDASLQYSKADANDIVIALTTFFAGLQFGRQYSDYRELAGKVSDGQSFRKALVDRVIVIDPLGGIPSHRQGHGTQVFINLEDEFKNIQDALYEKTQPTSAGTKDAGVSARATVHLENLRLAKSTLALLPSNASVVMTSPAEAANINVSRRGQLEAKPDGFAGEVKTRTWRNPLIHNLLTDRPIYSSSLPIGRIKPTHQDEEIALSRMPTTTLAKRGLPVTIFPDPRVKRWQPPQPGVPRLRLTDTCIDLPRLVHLINDSFGRKLNVEHYLDRLKDSLAGIIIAGEYEGGAILTWETPFGLDEETAYREGRLVPYLDKFAVLRKSQGAGGVADIVFNAMVRDAFPDGVCWRSRKDNPVNKWYFERSRGVLKLPESNWAMFWTTPEAVSNDQMMRDYEDVCRNIAPSWADTTKPAD
ncbi:acetylglutamate synthase [Neurospora tetrasperma FGSC 2508]|uniref:Amino-acid acetyltransferase, mitochondrial n=1 Tax=Neurospora tetrasperma (strain FGSC 2508 / ATCC MYA-4615 / P0657) TaxID=510951 RepID=F8MJ18_NEUT8|nr:acetylglutamate synthase [Neurospora tetrasperma FGSC 2508]EGO59067.1 acetylglutamate synthase [Neurospora tetrasperma FGSC 2508]